MAATKVNINVNVVRGHSYENFQHENLSYESFFCTEISRSTVYKCYVYVASLLLRLAS